MGYDNLAAFLDEIYDGFGCDLDSFHLLRKGIAQCIAAQGDDDNTFFLFSIVIFPL